MKAYFEMMRPINCLMSVIAVFIGGLLVVGWDFQHLMGYSPLYPALLVVFLITGAGNAINDYFDVEPDKINRPKRPIPSGRSSRGGALFFSAALFLSGIMIAGFINWIVFWIAVVNSIVLILYSSHLQNKLFIGNLTVGYLTGSTFLFGGAAMNNIVLPIWLALLAGLATVSREIIKDVEDIRGDKMSFLQRMKFISKNVPIQSSVQPSETAPVAERFGVTTNGIEIKMNKKKLLYLAAAALLVSVALSPMPYIVGILGFNYLIAVIITDIVFIFASVQMILAHEKTNYRSIQRIIKIGMLLGLISFVVGVWL